MKTYTEFHGEILISEIGKRLREIVKNSHEDFKIMTGYGSHSTKSKSKDAALKSLKNMKKEGLIKGYFPGEVRDKLLFPNDAFYSDKLSFDNRVKNDPDYGNDGIIFIFIK